MTELIARRAFSPVYIGLDTAFLLLFAALLLWKRRYMTVVVGGLAGILYMLVDYGIFHLLCGARSISPGYSLFWVLLWMSMSYGFTNFTWIWLWLSKDAHLFSWSFLILLWWFVCPQLAATFSPADDAQIVIERTTGAYHGYMALLLFVGYLGVILYNLWQGRPECRPCHWRACAVWLGSGTAHRGNPFCRLSFPCGKAASAYRQFPFGNQSWYAVYVPHLHRVLQSLHRGFASAENAPSSCRTDRGV